MRLTEYHYLLINDKSFFYSLTDLKTPKNSLKKPFHDLWERTKRNHRLMRNVIWLKRLSIVFLSGIKVFCDKYLKVFSPEHTIRIFWDFLLLFSLIVNIFYIPLTIGFEIENDYLHFEVINIIFNILPNLVFMMDMVINMNTAYYSKGEYVIKRKKILKNYVRSYFFIDFITIGPVILHWISSSLFWMREIDIFSIFRLLKIQQLILKMNEYLHLESKAQGLLNLLKLLFINLFVAHICGCCWNYIGLYQNKRFYYDNWLIKNNMIDASMISKYITCFYWSVTTMITVGYGDIIAYTDIERGFSIGVMLLSCGVFAYALNAVGSIFQEMFKKDGEFRAKLVDISYYMKKRGIGKNLQSKIKRYMEYMHEEELYGYQRGTELINGLSNKLQEEICEDLYGKILKNIKIFKENKFSQQFLKKLALKTQEITFAPGDFIFLEKENDENRLYFIMNGEIELFLKPSVSKDNDLIFSNLSTLKVFCFKLKRNLGFFIEGRLFRRVLLLLGET